MRNISWAVKFLGILITAMLFTGCGLNFTIKEPVVSTINYSTQKSAPVTLHIVDSRSGNETHFVMGKLVMNSTVKDISDQLVLNNIKDPIKYFAAHLEKELNSRGIATKCVLVGSAAAGLTLEIKRYQIVNYRAASYSPWEACHIFSAILHNNRRQMPIKAYFYNGKLPDWSTDEIVEPCFNIPTSVIIKEVASKINRAVFSLQAPIAKVEMLTSEIEADFEKNDTGESFWKVLELGHTNNPVAMVPLKMYSQKGDEFLRSCAITAIGTLGAEDQFDFLKARYNAGGFNDRYMTVKAIGDINTPEALRFIQELKYENAYNEEGGLKSCVDLYVP